MIIVISLKKLILTNLMDSTRKSINFNLTTFYASSKVYDPSTDTWTMGPSLTGFRQGFCAVATDDAIYISGGFDQV